MHLIAERLRQRRQALSLNQTELAELVGCSREQISQWETGHRQPAANHLCGLAKALRCSADHILGLQPIVALEAAQAPAEMPRETSPAVQPAMQALDDGPSTLDEVLNYARAQGRTYHVHLGNAYRLRKDGWEPV